MKYDIGVIGGGPGGYVAAIKAAQMGAKTILFEKDSLGGTCLNRGCIPTKALLKSAQLYHELQNAADFGIQAEKIGFDFKKIMARKNQVVRQLVVGVGGLLKKNGVTVVQAEADLATPGVITADGAHYEARDVILAMGSRPARPPISGVEHALTSDEVLGLETLPESVILVGGGVIGVEFAALLSTLGSKVTVIELLPSILAMADEVVIEQAEHILKNRGVNLVTGAKVLELRRDGAIYEQGGRIERIDADCVVLAIGRTSAAEPAWLERLGIRHNRGRVCTDLQMRTNLPHVWAIGDLNGTSMLAHTASREGVVAVRNILGQPCAMDYSAIPSCVYTTPEIAWIGLTEGEAVKQGRKVKTGCFPMVANGKSLIEGETGGTIKLVADQDTGELLGGHLVCAHATDMVMELGLLMGLEGTAEDLAEAVHPHPTVSEAVMEAAEAVLGKAVHC